MQTGYKVSSLSVPVISRISHWAGGSISLDRLGVGVNVEHRML